MNHHYQVQRHTDYFIEPFSRAERRVATASQTPAVMGHDNMSQMLSCF